MTDKEYARRALQFRSHQGRTAGNPGLEAGRVPVERVDNHARLSDNAKGNAVAFYHDVEAPFGKISALEQGFLLNNEMDDFSVKGTTTRA